MQIKTKELFKIILVLTMSIHYMNAYTLEKQLKEAIFTNNINKVQKFVELGANVNKADGLGFKPLVHVMKSGYDNVEIFDYLISKGAQYKDDNIIEIIAIMYSSKNIMKYLISQDSYYQNDLNERLIRNAIKSLKLSRTKRLIYLGADVNYQNEVGLTALSEAITFDELKTVKLLISKGAKLKNPYLLNLLIRRGHLNIFKELYSSSVDINMIFRNGDGTFLINAVSSNNIDIVKYLISKGADINIKDQVSEDYALSNAVRNKNIEIFNYLVSKGAKLNMKSRMQRTILDEAIESKSLKMIDLVLSHIDVNNEDSHYTFENNCKYESLSIIKKFIEKGIDLNRNFYAIRNALTYNRFDIAQLLINSGLDVNGYKKLDAYPLSSSVVSQKNNIKKINFLIKNGINLDAEDKYGRTTIFHAIYKDDLEMIKLLVANNADYNYISKFYRTPLDNAIYNKKEKIIKYLKSIDAKRTVRSRLTEFFDKL